jgi:hypothetical protein
MPVQGRVVNRRETETGTNSSGKNEQNKFVTFRRGGGRKYFWACHACPPSLPPPLTRSHGSRTPEFRRNSNNVMHIFIRSTNWQLNVLIADRWLQNKSHNHSITKNLFFNILYILKYHRNKS